MKSALWIGAALVGLSACVQAVPDSGAGVGFGDYGNYLAGAEPAGTLPTGTPIVPPQPVAQSEDTAVSSQELAAAGIGGPTTTTTTTTTAARQGLEASPTNAAPPLYNNAGISDEQDFSAVAGRESIQSDADRIAANAAQYEIIAPEAVPERHGDIGPNIVEYALHAPNVKGQEWYSRFRLSGQARFQRNCAKYTSPDAAQRDFLARGGPERDVLGIDPDGDGFACGWDPAPFLLALQSGSNG